MTLEKVVANLVQQIEHRFYGKYRGFVVDNADPEQLGRLRVEVPSVLGTEVVTGWAMPCVPYGGELNQGFLFIPEVGAGVWVEFEEGDLEFPIWVGTFWSKPGGQSELPKPNEADGKEQAKVQQPATRKIIKTKKGHTIQFEDADGQEMVMIWEATNGHVITMNKAGITITDGTNKNEIFLDKAGVTITDSNGNEAIMTAQGVRIKGKALTLEAQSVKIGSSAATQALVQGTLFKTMITTFIGLLNAHTHIGNLGAPTGPPTGPMQLKVPLSQTVKTE